MPPSVPQGLAGQVQEHGFQIGLDDFDVLHLDVVVLGQIEQAAK